MKPLAAQAPYLQKSLNGAALNQRLGARFRQKPAGRFMIRSRTRVVKRHPEGDW
jgi:hypothetical protein